MKKIFIRFAFIVLAAVVCAVSCTTPRYVSAKQSLSDQWIGKTYADIVQVYGAPTREVSDGRGGTIEVYEYGSQEVVPEYGDAVIVTKGENYIQFFMDEKDVCYNILTDKTVRDGNKPYYLGDATLITIGLMLIYSLFTHGII